MDGDSGKTTPPPHPRIQIREASLAALRHVPAIHRTVRGRHGIYGYDSGSRLEGRNCLGRNCSPPAMFLRAW